MLKTYKLLVGHEVELANLSDREAEIIRKTILCKDFISGELVEVKILNGISLPIDRISNIEVVS